MCCYSRAGVTFKSALKSVHGQGTPTVEVLSHLNRIVHRSSVQASQVSGATGFFVEVFTFDFMSC